MIRLKSIDISVMPKIYHRYFYTITIYIYNLYRIMITLITIMYYLCIINKIIYINIIIII